jgi:hypothetical protein
MESNSPALVPMILELTVELAAAEGDDRVGAANRLEHI